MSPLENYSLYSDGGFCFALDQTQCRSCVRDCSEILVASSMMLRKKSKHTRRKSFRFSLGEVSVLTIDRLELDAIDGYNR